MLIRIVRRGRGALARCFLSNSRRPRNAHAHRLWFCRRARFRLLRRI